MKQRTNVLTAQPAFPWRIFGGTPLLAAGLLLAVATAVAAAEPVTLDALVADTVDRNPEVQFYEAEISAARGGRMTAGAWANPELSSELGHKQVRDLSGNSIGDGPIWSVSVEVFLYGLFFAACRLLPVRAGVLAGLAALGRGMLSFFAGGCVYFLYRACVRSPQGRRHALLAGVFSRFAPAAGSPCHRSSRRSSSRLRLHSTVR